MYRRKIFLFGAVTAVFLMIALICASLSAYLTRINLQQSNIAQSLHLEHQRLSSISYRLFKQFTDEYIFGANANQADVRNKTAIIDNIFSTIRDLEIQQRQALGEVITQGSIEDTDELERIVTEIITGFQSLLTDEQIPTSQQKARLSRLLELNIDNQFREAIDTALSRQERVVAALNARIDTLNKTLFWFTICLGILSTILLIYGCYWLFGQLYQPLILIQNATDRIAAGNYQNPITEKLDDEFDALVKSINHLGERLRQHVIKENQSRAELEYQVEQRTTALVKANSQLTELDSRRRQFINDISHELRTPLTVIRGEAQVTLRIESSTAEDYKTTLSSIESQAINLSRLVDDLLLLARSELDELHLHFVSENIFIPLSEEIEKWQRAYRNIAITFEYDESIKTLSLSIDRQRIQQVLSILIDNAIKYAKTTQPITIRAKLHNDYVAISVEDRGKGISANEIEHIFERFVRFRRNSKGHGLGLPIAKTIVEAHGGEISVTSTPDELTSFVVKLPLGNS